MDEQLRTLMHSMQLHFQSPISHHEPMRRRHRSSRKSSKSLTDFEVTSIIHTMTEDQREHHFKNLRPAYLTLRPIVTEWLLDIGEYFGLHSTTAHAAISYLDRIQPNEKFCTFQWQMVAICCLTVSAKYNEMEQDVPDLHTLGGIIGQDIPYNVHLDYELWVLKQMGWKLNARTPLSFLSCYTCLGVVFPDEVTEELMGGVSFKEVHSMVIKHASILSNLVILDVRFKAYPASLVAAAILYLARKNVGLSESWRIELSELVRADPMSFLCIVQDLEAEARDILDHLQLLSEEKKAAARAVERHLEPSHSYHHQHTPLQCKIDPVKGYAEGKPSPDSVADLLCL